MSGSFFYVLCYICGVLLVSPAVSFVTAEDVCEQDVERCCYGSETKQPTITVTLMELPKFIAECSRSTSTDIAVPYDLGLNMSYSCKSSSGKIIWQLGGECGTDEPRNTLFYQMFEQNKFEKSGIIVQETAANTTSTLTLQEEGRKFLSSQLQSGLLVIQCLAVVENVNVFGGDVYRVQLYGKPCQPKNVVLYTNTSASGTLHWKRPHCMSELVTLSYNVTVTSITDNKVVYKATTSNTWITIDPTKVECGMTFMFAVEAISGCSGSSQPAIINASLHSIEESIFGLSGGPVAAISLSTGLLVGMIGMCIGCTVRNSCINNENVNCCS